MNETPKPPSSLARQPREQNAEHERDRSEHAEGGGENGSESEGAGKFAEMEPMRVKILEMRRRIAGPESAATLWEMAELANNQCSR